MTIKKKNRHCHQLPFVDKCLSSKLDNKPCFFNEESRNAVAGTIRLGATMPRSRSRIEEGAFNQGYDVSMSLRAAPSASEEGKKKESECHKVSHVICVRQSHLPRQCISGQTYKLHKIPVMTQKFANTY